MKSDNELILQAIELAIAGKRVVVLTWHYRHIWHLSALMREMAKNIDPSIPIHAREDYMRIGEGRIDFANISREEKIYGITPDVCLIHDSVCYSDLPDYVRMKLDCKIWSQA